MRCSRYNALCPTLPPQRDHAILYVVLAIGGPGLQPHQVGAPGQSVGVPCDSMMASRKRPTGKLLDGASQQIIYRQTHLCRFGKRQLKVCLPDKGIGSRSFPSEMLRLIFEAQGGIQIGFQQSVLLVGARRSHHA